MGILIGMDEAGYGPNFGPLVVAATAWEVAEEREGSRGRGGTELQTADCGLRINGTRTQSAIRNPKSEIAPDLYRLLRSVVARSASERRIAIADSKALYHPGLGLRQLERGVHAVLSSIGQSHQSWSALVAYCGADPAGHHRCHCWPDGHDSPLPIDAAADELARLGERFQRACAAAGVRPLLIRARLVFPGEFNELVEHYGTKGAALSHVTVGLLRKIVDTLSVLPVDSPAASPQLPLFAVCDKHGGRNFYTALLQHHFSDHWIEPVFENRAESRYEWGPAETRACVAFRMNGEQFLPTALASMTAKYLRELAMRAFNAFWSTRVPGLKPTAGYPTDARRFKQAIAAVQRELGIDDHVLWRSR